MQNTTNDTGSCLRIEMSTPMCGCFEHDLSMDWSSCTGHLPKVHFVGDFVISELLLLAIPKSATRKFLN